MQAQAVVRHVAFVSGSQTVTHLKGGCNIVVLLHADQHDAQTVLNDVFEEADLQNQDSKLGPDFCGLQLLTAIIIVKAQQALGVFREGLSIHCCECLLLIMWLRIWKDSSSLDSFERPLVT